jgi:hypothetical protein
MDSSLSEFDVDTLRALYERESGRLRQALLEGVSWDELRDQRKNVTELAAAIHKRRHATDNPAEASRRNDPE